jgi:hypothetical protein
MGDVARTGRTVVLVSHQLNQIRRLCHRVVWVDDGKVRQDGPAHEVVSAYESAMARNERAKGLQRLAGQQAQFFRWEITEHNAVETHTVSTLGPVTINFRIALAAPVSRPEHGVALYNAERQLLWARAQQINSLPAGEHVFSHSLSSLPLRPGAYQWQVSLWSDQRCLDLWDCTPDMIIATEGHQHHMDEWNGILNLPADFAHKMYQEAHS